MNRSTVVILSLFFLSLFGMIAHLSRESNPGAENRNAGTGPVASASGKEHWEKRAELADRQRSGKQTDASADSPEPSSPETLSGETARDERGGRAPSLAASLLPGMPPPLPVSEDFLDTLLDPSGRSVSFVLPGGERAVGTVQILERDAAGVRLVQGRLTAPRPGFYFFNRETLPGVLGAFFGNVRFDEGTLAYRIEAIGSGETSALVARSLDQVICVGLPPPEMAAHTAPDAPAGESANAPQTHPDDIPIPDYQAILPLQSLPGAAAVLFLDFEGGEGPWIGWGDFDIVAPGTTNAQVKEIWERVSEDFQPFNINVTTDRRVFLNAPRNSRQRVMITPTDTASPGNGGVAQYWAFNSTADAVCWAFYSVGKNSAEVISHEIGHTLGLSHDGRAVPGEKREEYFGGYGGGPTGWAPIMGVGYYQNLTQWSKGEYPHATNTEDDLAIITNNNNAVDYRDDVVGDDLAGANYLEIFAGYTVSDEGIIEKEGDVDAFRFETTGGDVSLRVRPVNRGPNLDIKAEIVDAAGGVIGTVNPSNEIEAALEADLDPGEYLLRVTSTGRTTGDGNDYSTYATLGAYLISGTVANAVLPVRFSVSENPEAGSEIGGVNPRNRPRRLQPVYAIASGNESGAFAIDASTGALRVADPAPLDFERLSTRWDDPATIELFVTITYPSAPANNERIRVVVTVENENEPPTLGDASVRLFSGTAIGTEFLTLDGADPDPFDFVDYAIVAGNPDDAFTIDPSTGTLSVAEAFRVGRETVFPLTVSATDQGNPPLKTEATVSVTVFPLAEDYTPGSIVRTFYEGLGGTAVSDLTGHVSFPDQPDAEAFLSSFEGGEYGNNYGSAFRGFLLVPLTGNYRFWIASDDGGDFLLSSSANPEGAISRATVPGHTDPRDFEKYPEQKSAWIPLQGGAVYYVEARHKEGGGGDHLSVAWEGPGISRQVIPGHYLAPYRQNYAPSIATERLTIRPEIYNGARFGTIEVADINTTDSHHSFRIIRGAGRNVFAIDPETGVLSIGEARYFSTGQSHELVIGVTDSGTPPKEGRGTVTVEVINRTSVEAEGIVQQIWDDFNGSTANLLESDPRYPDFPTRTRILSSFDSGDSGLGDRYGSRIRTFLVPPTSGNYRFYIASDDHSELRFSADGDPDNASVVARVDGWIDPPAWAAQRGQGSQLFSLVAGRRYYMETLHRNGTGGDYIQVGWTGPGIEEIQVIPGEHLEPFDINGVPLWEDDLSMVTLPVGAPEGTVVAELKAVDPENGWLTYAILEGDDEKIFALDAQTGELRIAKADRLPTDRILELRIGVQDDGTGGIYPYKTAERILAVAAGGIESWRMEQFGTDALNPLIAGDQADPDGDGFANLIEYALGLDPTTTDAKDAWTVTVETEEGEQYLQLDIARNPLATDIEFTFEVTDDLSRETAWTESNATVQILSPTKLRFRDTVPVSTTDARFIRLRITRE